MSQKDDKPPSIEEAKRRMANMDKSWFKDLFNPKISDFDERGLASGSEDSLTKTDADLFPSDIEDYSPEERRQKMIKDNIKKSE